MSNKSETILIVDDTIENLRLLSQILIENGYKVRAAKSGKEALASTNESMPDLILLDVKMPDLNGYEVCEKLKANEKTSSIPVLFLSSLTEEEDRLRGFTVGGVDYITKPFSYKEVIMRVKTHLEIARFRTIQNEKLKLINEQLILELEEQKKQEESIRKLNRLYSVLYDIDEAIVQIHDKKKLFEEVCRIAFSDGNFLMSWIGIVNDKNKVDVVASSGFSEDYLSKIDIDLNDPERSSGPTGRAIKSGKYAFSNDIENDINMTPWKKDALRLGYKAASSLPLKVSGKVIGVLNIYANEVGFFTTDEIKLLEKLASNLSFAIEFIENEEDKKRAENALSESETHIKSISDNFTNGMIYQLIIKPDGSRKFTYLSSSVKNLYGISPEEGIIDSNLIYKRLYEADLQLLQKTENEAIKNVSAFKVEVRIKEPSGEIRWSLLISKPKKLNDGSICFDGIEFIITERKLTENIIHAHLKLNNFSFNHSLHELLQKTLDEVCIITSSPIGFYHFVEADQKTLSLQAWSTSTLKEYCKANGEGLHYNLDKAGVWADCVRERKPIIHNNYDALANRKGLPEGHAKLVRELVVPIMRDGLIVAILGIGNKEIEYTDKDIELVSYFADVAWEITQKKRVEEKIHTMNEELEHRVTKRTEELENANKELESFSYSVSHDLRAPLRAIDGFSTILTKNYAEKLGEEEKRLLSRVSDNAKKMSHLIDDLLTFSRTNRKEINKAEVDVKLIVKSVYDEITSEEEKTKIDFSINDLPKVKGDEAMIKQVWINLISNAVKFTSKIEKPKIEISFKVDNEKTIYFIKDNGVGFDMTYATKLFSVFQRLHTEDQYKGTGVGLAIVKSIITKHGGKIWVKSEIDKGTTFYFWI